jgi:formate dehydrogenase subunit beta
LRATAAELLSEGAVELVIGYALSPDGSVVPRFAQQAEEAGELIWNERCAYNLVRYLTEPDLLGPEVEGAPSRGDAADKPARGSAADRPAARIAVTVKGCDLKSLVVLLAEGQVRRDQVIVIGLPCAGVVDEEGRVLGKCSTCPAEVRNPRRDLCDVVVGSGEDEPPVQEPAAGELYQDVAQIDALSTRERREFWDGHFSRCLRCYACRNVCPLCYCKECVFDQHNPCWVSPAPSVSSNRAFHLIRAYHLAGRCVDCGECERACPVGIPLRRINRKMARVVRESFHFEAGVDPEAKAPIAAFAAGDPEEFIE